MFEKFWEFVWGLRVLLSSVETLAKKRGKVAVKSDVELLVEKLKFIWTLHWLLTYNHNTNTRYNMTQQYLPYYLTNLEEKRVCLKIHAEG